MIKWLKSGWERVLFAFVGLAFLGISFWFLFVQKVPEAAAVFGLGLMSFIYANLARFKKVKGFGLEAELWEDKQKEAEHLIDRLRGVVSIYTREVVLQKVATGRWMDRVLWRDRWKLYDELVSQHDVLGQKIDFSELKKTVDDYFLFDMCRPEMEKARLAVFHGKGVAHAKINSEFGSPVQDAAAFSKRLEQLNAIPDTVDNPFRVSTTSDLAGRALATWLDAKQRFKRDFDIDVSIDAADEKRLTDISMLYSNRPIAVTDELIRWADRDAS